MRNPEGVHDLEASRGQQSEAKQNCAGGFGSDGVTHHEQAGENQHTAEPKCTPRAAADAQAGIARRSQGHLSTRNIAGHAMLELVPTGMARISQQSLKSRGQSPELHVVDKDRGATLSLPGPSASRLVPTGSWRSIAWRGRPRTR